MWQMYGIRHNKPWDKPLYVNTGYPFTYDPVTYSVMSDRPSDWTYNNLMKNPVGSYRREFVLPSGWSERTVYVRFNGVGHGYYLWVNGQYVGYSEDSYLPSEFDITPYLQSGKNVIAAQVYRFTSGSFWNVRTIGVSQVSTAMSSYGQHLRLRFAIIFHNGFG